MDIPTKYFFYNYHPAIYIEQYLKDPDTERSFSASPPITSISHLLQNEGDRELNINSGLDIHFFCHLSCRTSHTSFLLVREKVDGHCDNCDY